MSPTLVLAVLNITAYIFTSLVGGNFFVTDLNVAKTFGQYNYFVLRGGYWQLFTAMFVHLDIVHVVSNLIFLVIFGLRAEELFKNEEYYLIYFSSGLAGNIFTLLMGPWVISAGASGAIFGLFGANIIFLRRVVGGHVGGALLFAFFFLLISVSKSTNIFAHFGGLICGLILGYVLASSRIVKHVTRIPYRV
ncbi:MAG: rhomboid family intramembrane serine protease [Candidatus Bathyarchaeia archaeon]